MISTNNKIIKNNFTRLYESTKELKAAAQDLSKGINSFNINLPSFISTLTYIKTHLNK